MKSSKVIGSVSTPRPHVDAHVPRTRTPRIESKPQCAIGCGWRPQTRAFVLNIRAHSSVTARGYRSFITWKRQLRVVPDPGPLITKLKENTFDLRIRMCRKGPMSLLEGSDCFNTFRIIPTDLAWSRLRRKLSWSSPQTALHDSSLTRSLEIPRGGCPVSRTLSDMWLYIYIYLPWLG